MVDGFKVFHAFQCFSYLFNHVILTWGHYSIFLQVFDDEFHQPDEDWVSPFRFVDIWSSDVPQDLDLSKETIRQPTSGPEAG